MGSNRPESASEKSMDNATPRFPSIRKNKHLIDLSPLLKVSSRLLNLHDSSRGPGASTQYQTEKRPGLEDGRYVAIASEVKSHSTPRFEIGRAHV